MVSKVKGRACGPGKGRNPSSSRLAGEPLLGLYIFSPHMRPWLLRGWTISGKEDETTTSSCYMVQESDDVPPDVALGG